uniref:H-2 class II histocompatibility antigen, A-Q alpha chain-like n=1 Tax=Pundamilia nyererei TaxID=303518 RepID=A0A3B4FGZ9_9CICH
DTTQGAVLLLNHMSNYYVHTLCHIYGCFDSSDTQICAAFDGDEIYYADFKKDLLIWESKIPTSFRSPDIFFLNEKVEFKQIMCSFNLEPPEFIIYPRDEVITGEDNTLICFINHFFPPLINIKWTKNDVEVTMEDPFIKTLSNPDGTAYVLSYLNFVPEKGDIYSCTVEHEAMDEPQTKFWSENKEIKLKLHNYEFHFYLTIAVGLCGLVIGFVIAISGIIYCITVHQIKIYHRTDRWGYLLLYQQGRLIHEKMRYPDGNTKKQHSAYGSLNSWKKS